MIGRASIAIVLGIAVLWVASASGGTPQEERERERLEQQRLRLEIEKLRRESGRGADVLRWFPAVSVLVAAGVAIFGGARYFDERKRTLRAQTEERVGHNLERLVDPSMEGVSRSARALVALRNLDKLAPPDGDETAMRHRVEVTTAVTEMVRELTEFSNVDDARLPVICLQRWHDFKKQCSGEPEWCREILARYVEAVDHIKNKSAPEYVKSVKREKGRYVSDAAIDKRNERFFAELITGFERYVDVLSDDAMRREAFGELSLAALQLGPQLASERGITCAGGTPP